MASKSQWTIKTLKKYMESRFRASDHATNTAYISMEKRLDGMNELRSAMKDQSTTFITRHEFDNAIESIRKLENWQAQQQGQSTQGSSGRAQNNWIIALVITIVMFIITMSVQIIRH